MSSGKAKIGATHTGAMDENRIDTPSSIEVPPDFASQDLAFLKKRAVALRKAGFFQESISTFKFLRNKHPDRPALTQGLIDSCRAGAQLAGSLRTVQEVLSEIPDHRGALIGRVDIAARRLNMDAALEFLDAALLAFPEDPSLKLRRCVLLRSLGRLRESEACIARLDASGTAERLERINIDLALHRFEEAKKAARALQRAQPDDTALATEAIRVLQTAGALEEATVVADRARESWPKDARIAASLIRCHLLAAEGEREAEGLLDALPEDMASHPALSPVKVLLALRAGDHARAEELALQQGGGGQSATLPSLAVVRGRLKAALAAGLESRFAARILGEIRKALDESAAALAPDILARLNLEVASTIGDWQSVSHLTAALRERQPRDLYLVSSAARAAFEAGDFEAAERALSAVLEQHPHHPPARKMSEALDLVAGRIPDYLDGRQAKISYRNPNFIGDHLGLVSDLFTIDEPGQAISCLESCQDFAEARSRVQASLQFWTVDTRSDTQAEPDGDQPRPDLKEMDDEDFVRLMDFDDRTIPAGPDLREEAFLAWRLCREGPGRFDEWRRTAFRATNANIVIGQEPLVSKRIGRWLEPVDTGVLEPYLGARQPLLLVGSHSGPRVFDVLDDVIPNLFYVVRGKRLPAYDRLSGTLLHIGSRFDAVAAQVFRALRQGKRAYFVADAPIGLARRGRPAPAANGRIFGVPCGLVNTVPKLSRGLRIPSFWVQAVWRGGRIVVDIEQLPQAAPEEDDQAWCDRWAQAYLDKLERLMSSAPENVDLKAPMWRYLLLKGKGSEFDRPVQAPPSVPSRDRGTEP